MISRRILAAAAALLYVLVAPSHAVAQVQQVFSTLAAATAATIPSGVDTVTTLGRNTAGDYGGASYIRIGASTAAAWRFQSADGQWWALNNRIVTPEMFGCFSGGVNDCTAAFGAIATVLNTFAGGYTVNFTPNGEYLVWPAGTTPAAVMTLSNVNGATFNFNGARIYTNNAFSASIGPAVFNIHNSSNLIFNDPSYACVSCSGTIDPLKYGVLFYINETTGPWSNNIQITNATASWVSSFLIVTGDITGATQEQAHNVSVINADLQHVFYGLSFQASGDNFFGRGVKCTDCGRIYFPWNVSNHDVEVIKNGGGSGFVSVILKAFGLPAGSDAKRALSNIRLKYRDVERTVTDSTAVAIGLDMQQTVAQPNVSGATNNGGLVRLTVDSTANMATGQKWFVNGVGGLTGVNDKSWPITVISPTEIELQGSAFAGSYTSGGYMRVPAALRDIDIQAETTLGASQPPAFSTYKENSDGSADTTVNGYEVENVSFSGSLKGYDYGVPAISLFTNNGISNGTWSGERLRNISLRDLTVTGTNSSVIVDTTGAVNFELKNIYSTATAIPWTVTGSPRVINVSATGVTDRLAVAPSAAVSNFFLTGLGTDGILTSARPTYDNLSGNIPTGTIFDGTLVGSSVPAPSSPAVGKLNIWFDSTDARLHDKNSFGVIGTTVISDAGAANNFLTGIGPAGFVTKAQPSLSNLSGWGAGALSAAGNTVNASGGLVTFNGAFGAASGTSLTLTGSLVNLGTAAVVGPGGTGTANAAVVVNGGSASGGGAGILFMRNSVGTFTFGNSAALTGGPQNDIALYNWGLAAYSMKVTASDSSVIFGSTTASTSSATGSVTTAGGIGAAGAIYGGAEVATGAVIVRNLPPCDAAHKAARHFVTDATATFTAGIGDVVMGFGGHNVPVTCDGINWRIGANDHIPAHLVRKFA
jgi:hypothetical protein